MSQNKNWDAEIDYEIPDRSKPDKVPRFFSDRAAGWYAVAAVILSVTVVFTLTVKDATLLLPAAAASLLCFLQGARLILTAKKGRYFTLRLTCTDVRPLNFVENLPLFMTSPASNSASRGSKQVTFRTETGKQIFFTYERSRKFIPGVKYDFYFHIPQYGETITVDMLERLRIDHAIVPDEISKEDMQRRED